ncbi:hypothetical protein AB0C70_24995 [Streptomyces sp. NPDC048564]|uniref:hypothetical protein n=1 Tax=Streptomyces sp. NPDC048564 TaxID=3155760 RepID=UPI0034356B77
MPTAACHLEGMQRFARALRKYAPDSDPANQFNAYGWAAASSLDEALDASKCLTRDGLRDAVGNLKDVKVDMLLPGVTPSTGPGDAFPLETMQLTRFKGRAAAAVRQAGGHRQGVRFPGEPSRRGRSESMPDNLRTAPVPSPYMPRAQVPSACASSRVAL